MTTPCCGNCRHAAAREQTPEEPRVRCDNGVERIREFSDYRNNWRPACGWCPLHSSKGEDDGT